MIDAGPFWFGTRRNDPLRGFNDREAQNIDMETFCVDRYEFQQKGTMPRVNTTWLKPLSCQRAGKRLYRREWGEPAKGRVVTAFRSGIGRSLERAMSRVLPAVPHRLRQLELSPDVRAPSGLSTCRATWQVDGLELEARLHRQGGRGGRRFGEPHGALLFPDQ